MIDLDAYCERVGYDGPLVPTPEVLRELHRLHPQAIAFENLDSFLGRPVLLDLPSLERKLVHDRRGGYCFEQNLLFMAVLRAIGFTVRGLAARVVWGRPADAEAPLSHMLLSVEVGGATHVADVGFGGLTQTAPLLLAPGREQATPHETFRIARDPVGYRLEARMGSEWRALYRFGPAEHFPPDYATFNYFVATNPASIFVNGLILARPLADRRYALSNNRLTVHPRGGESETRVVGTAEELAGIIEDRFGIAIPDRDRFEARLVEQGIVAPTRP